MIEYYWRLRGGQQRGRLLIWMTSNFISMFKYWHHCCLYGFVMFQCPSCLKLFLLVTAYQLVIMIPLSNNRCVRLARFENDRTISFIPPDGAFDLMTYRLSTQVNLHAWWLDLHCKPLRLFFFALTNSLMVTCPGETSNLGRSSDREALEKSYWDNGEIKKSV